MINLCTSFMELLPTDKVPHLNYSEKSNKPVIQMFLSARGVKALENYSLKNIIRLAFICSYAENTIYKRNYIFNYRSFQLFSPSYLTTFPCH